MNGQVVSRQQHRLEAGRRGSCMTLWRGADVRGALWALRGSVPRETVTPLVPGPVGVRGATSAERQVGGPRIIDGACCAWPRSARPVDPIVDAWVQVVRERMDGRSVCFFTGTYRDDYGFPMGLMKARNVQRDFRRFLHEQGFDDTEWVCAVEAHRYRVILHLHALLSGVTPEQGDALKFAWDTSRGWSTAPACTDGGVAYTCKYALKAAEGDAFDWSW